MSRPLEPPPNRLEIPFSVTGPVQRGDRRGREIGFPTLNLAAPAAGIADGVWAGWVRVDTPEGSITLAAAISVGTRATFYSNGGERLIEAHVPGLAADLYDRTVTVEMCEHLREQRAFRSVDELTEQLRRDVAQTLDWWQTATQVGGRP